MDYYETLGVSRDASPEEIKKAYRRLSKEHHPDKKKGSGSDTRYKEINRAYECLSNSKKKQAYDQFGSEDGHQFSGGGGGGFSGSPFGGGNFSDIFETFFGGQAGRSGQREERGQDAEVAVQISLADAFAGGAKTIRLTRPVVCDDCSGSGAAKGSKTVSCSTCGGTGQVTRAARSFFGMVQQSMVCDECRGSGKVPEAACATCSGEGRVQGSDDVTVEIPPGIRDGQTLRVRSKGAAGRQGIPAGDLYVHVRVADDPKFQRDGDDLRTVVEISVAEAVLGTEVTIKTFAGNVKLKVPAGTQPEQILRLKGKGMPVLSSSRHGDLFVVVRVEVPRKLSRKEKGLWEDIRGE